MKTKTYFKFTLKKLAENTVLWELSSNLKKVALSQPHKNKISNLFMKAQTWKFLHLHYT